MLSLQGLSSAPDAENSGLFHAFRSAWLLLENPPEVLVAQTIDGDVATLARRHALGRPFRRFGCVVPALRNGAAERAFHAEWFVFAVMHRAALRVMGHLRINSGHSFGAKRFLPSLSARQGSPNCFS